MSKRLIQFTGGLDFRARTSPPAVARLVDGPYAVKPGRVRFIVIGVEYGHIHTTGGDIRAWESYSGARRFLRRYLVERGAA